MRFKDFEQRWENTTIGKCSYSLEYGMNAAAKTYDGKHKYIRITDINEETCAFDPNPLSSPDGEYEEKYLVKENDILFARTGASVGKSYLYDTKDGELYFAGFLIRARIKPVYNGAFVYYQTKSKKYEKWVKLTSMRSGQPGINSQEYSSYTIGMTSRTEQDKIADFLLSLDRKIAVQNKIISDLKVLKKELMDYILNTCDFIELSIKDLIDCGFARIIKASEMKKFNGTRKYLSTSSIGENGIEEVESVITYTDRPSRASMLPIKGSIWFAKMKNSIKVYQSTDDDENHYILSTGFYGLLCDETKVNSRWIIELFKSDYFNTQKDKFSEGSSMSGIKDSQLADITLKVFSDKKQEIYHTNNIQNLSKKIQLEKDTLKILLKQKQFFLNAMFI